MVVVAAVGGYVWTTNRAPAETAVPAAIDNASPSTKTGRTSRTAGWSGDHWQGARACGGARITVRRPTRRTNCSCRSESGPPGPAPGLGQSGVRSTPLCAGGSSLSGDSCGHAGRFGSSRQPHAGAQRPYATERGG
jgi:hypothetical protein